MSAGPKKKKHQIVGLWGFPFGVVAFGHHSLFPEPFFVAHPELPPEPVPLADGVTFLGLRFSVSGEAGNGEGIRCQRLKRENLVIRVRQAGDYIRPFGMQGRKSLQDYLTDRRVDQPFRDRIPLICRGREVMVVCGVGAGDVEIQDTRDTQTDLYTWEGPMAWM